MPRDLHGPRAAGALRPLDLDTALLRTFQALAATRSFTRTAELVGRTQSAVSQQIQKLEELVGQKLVVRSRRQLQLTTAGEVLLGHVRQVLDGLDHAMATLQRPAPSGEVRFGSPEDFATFFLPDILARFMEEHPTVRLRTHCALTLELLEGLEAGNFELVVIKQEPGRLHPSAIPLWRERLVWVAAEERPRTPFDGDGGVKLVLSPEPCVYRNRAIASLGEAGLAWSVVYTSPSLAGAAAAVRAGLGITALPRNMVPPGLAPVDPALELPRLEETVMCLVTAAEPSPAVRAFAGFVRERLGH